MDRNEAATEYLAVLLGFRGAFRKFYEAAKMLTDDEKSLMHDAVSGAPRRAESYREQPFLRPLLENEYQNRKGEET